MKLLNSISVFMAVVFATACNSLSPYDLNAPFGWATCSSIEGGQYDLKGGSGGEEIVLESSAEDMLPAITEALNDYDIVVLDGSKGEFRICGTIEQNGVDHKTIVGINGATIVPEYYLDGTAASELSRIEKEVSASLRNADGELPAGLSENDEEVLVRAECIKWLLEYTHDHDGRISEGGILLDHCNDWIIRNISFVGPGSCSLEGGDCLSINTSTHVWVDHCSFVDGMDGNLDIGTESDFVTISWCTFDYTDRSLGHRFSNLIGGGDGIDREEDRLNTTFAFNYWGLGVEGRAPMGRYGSIHLFNNHYNCPANKGVVNPRYHSEFLVENNYFDEDVTGYNPYRVDSSYAHVWNGNSFARELPEGDFYTPTNKGNAVMPYDYSLAPAVEVPSIIHAPNGAGPTLRNPLKIKE